MGTRGKEHIVKQHLRELLAEAALQKELELRNGKKGKRRTVEMILDRRNRR